MRISNFQTRSSGDDHRVSATVAWEESERPAFELYFKTRIGQAPFDFSTYNAFLVACVSPALHFGERRIQIDGAVCPWLKDNLYTVMAWLNHWFWYDQGHRPGDHVAIEAKNYTGQPPQQAPRAGAFFSGGVDSLYTLHKNHSNLPPGHPGRIRDAIVVHGFDFGNRPQRGSEEEAFEFFLREFQPVFQETGIEAVPVWTNIYELGVDSTDFWLREFMGPSMGAVAHALSGRLTECYIASSYSIDTLHPFSSHPVLEPNLSSFNLRLHHDTERTTRVDKVKAISGWPTALAHLRVCFFGESGKLNCGLCAKCVRTKLELLCAGALDRAPVFAHGGVDVQLVRKALRISSGNIPFWRTLVRALSASGHHGLSRALAYNGYRYYIGRLADVRGAIAGIDRHLFRGAIKRNLRG